jgi:hypothetical protein
MGDKPDRVEGEIIQDDQGNVVIGAPTAISAAKAPTPGDPPPAENEEND